MLSLFANTTTSSFWSPWSKKVATKAIKGVFAPALLVRRWMSSLCATFKTDVKAAALTVANGAQGVVMCGIFIEGAVELGLLYANQQLNVRYSNLYSRMVEEAAKDGKTKEIEAAAAVGMWCHRQFVTLIALGLACTDSILIGVYGALKSAIDRLSA